jgi:hypothetical protein
MTNKEQFEKKFPGLKENQLMEEAIASAELAGAEEKWKVEFEKFADKWFWDWNENNESLIDFIFLLRTEAIQETAKRIGQAMAEGGLTVKELTDPQEYRNAISRILNSGKTMYQQGYKDGLNEKDTSCDEAFKLLKGKTSHDPIDRIMDRMGESDVY